MRSTSRTEARMVRVESITSVSFMLGGMEATSCGCSARTRSTVSMMLAPGWRKITTMMAGLPSARPSLRRSSTESCTSATSPTRRAAPFL